MVKTQVELWNKKPTNIVQHVCDSRLSWTAADKSVNTKQQQIDHSLETIPDQQRSDPQGWNAVNDREPGEKWLSR